MSQRCSHPIFARVYARISPAWEHTVIGEHREQLLAGLSGRVVEVGAGNGLNFGHYPPTVAEVVAVEPEPYLRSLAIEAARRATVRVTVIEGRAESLPFQDARFDAAVASLVLCSVADQHAALLELRRVLRPDGELRYYEHVVSRRPATARVQRLLDASLWPHVAGGCHMARDTGAAIRAAGFEIEREQRLAVKTGRVQPGVPHLLGVGRPARNDYWKATSTT
ncbi:MAG: class I SAM-dependent methyltransferase [Solirubrobacteraceae bacterium]